MQIPKTTNIQDQWDMNEHDVHVYIHILLLTINQKSQTPKISCILCDETEITELIKLF